MSMQFSRVRRIVPVSIRLKPPWGWYAIVPWLLAALALTTPRIVLAQEQLFVPMVSVGDTAVSRDPVEGSGDEPAACTLSDEETAVLAKMVSAPDQRRASVTCDGTLAGVARARAEDMASRDYFSHTNPDGEGPNSLVKQAGYILPDWYSQARDANNIESIAAGYLTPSEAWQGWMDSQGHRTHLLALEGFYAEQVMVGIGHVYLPDSRFKHYWVVISAPDEPALDAFASPFSIP